jgi:hypothetical protein
MSGSDPIAHLLLGHGHPLIGKCRIGCLLADAVHPTLDLLLMENEGRLPRGAPITSDWSAARSS